MLQISLDENASPEQVKKAISTIGFFVGEATMVLVLTGLAGDAGHAAPAAAIIPPTAASVPPPPPPPPGPPALIPMPELDAKGLPWDERIHSGNKSKNQDGSWKARKNVDDNVRAAIVAELRQIYPVPPLTVVPPVQQADAGAPPPPPPPPSAMPDIPPALDRRPPAAPQEAASGELTFREFMSKVTPLLAAGKLTQAQLSDACKTFSLLNVVQLGLPANAPLIPSVWAYVDAVVSQG